MILPDIGPIGFIQIRERILEFERRRLTGVAKFARQINFAGKSATTVSHGDEGV